MPKRNSWMCYWSKSWRSYASCVSCKNNFSLCKWACWVGCRRRPGTYRCVFVIDRKFSDSQIKAAFQKEWLDHHPQEKRQKPQVRPEREHWHPLLKSLGMLRILDCFQNNRVKADIFLQREFSRIPKSRFDTRSSAWSKAKTLMNNYLNLMHHYV